MKKNILLTMLSFTFCLSLTSCSNKIEEVNNQVNNVIENKLEAGEVASISETVTVGQMVEYLLTKNEHYPLSDEFIERYQQNDGGYIDKALKEGLLVDKLQHEPNQKWHFFESWFYPSLEEETISYTDDAKSRVYNKLLCPELLLWIYEACEVSPTKVRAAMKVAEEAKTQGTHISTMAKNMRGCVPWEDIAETILNAPSADVETYKVTTNLEDGVSISGLSNEYASGREVSFTVSVSLSTKQIKEVKVNDDIIGPVSGTKYKFTMPEEDVVISVTLKDKEIIDTPPSDGNALATYNISYDLGSRVTAKAFSTKTELKDSFILSGEGNDIINSISEMENMYGGANGGSGDNKWYTGDILKFGTTSVNGYLVLDLNCEVNSVKITGYVYASSCKIEVGDSNDSSKITSHTCSDMNVVSKEIVDGKQTSTITVDFVSTSNLKIATTSKKPIFITSIEFYKN